MKTRLDLLEDEIIDLYAAVSQVGEFFPQMADVVESPELEAWLISQAELADQQKISLQEICESLEIPTARAKSVTVERIFERMDELLADDAEEGVYDAGLLSCAQRLGNHLIAGYRSARHISVLNELEVTAELFEGLLDEQIEADVSLNEVSVRQIAPLLVA